MLKQSFATPCPLASLMDVEIQHTQGMYFILNTLHVLMKKQALSVITLFIESDPR